MRGGDLSLGITRKQPDQRHGSDHGEPKFIKGEQPYAQHLTGLNPTKMHIDVIPISYPQAMHLGRLPSTVRHGQLSLTSTSGEAPKGPS